MTKTIRITPVTRIEGHADVHIRLDEAGNVASTQVAFKSLRGFEQFVKGKPAEELPRIVSRICGICPWMHHIASVKAVDQCFGVTPAPAGSLLRELMLTIAHIEDKLLHFFFLSGADFLIGSDEDYRVRNIMGLAKTHPELTKKVVKIRQMTKMILDRFTHKAIHPVAAVPGGFIKPLSPEEQKEYSGQLTQIMDFVLFALEFAHENIFSRFEDQFPGLGSVRTGFMGLVDKNGALSFYDGKIRLMKPDGSYEAFDPTDYRTFIAEKTLDFSYGKFPYAKIWGQGFSLDPDAPRGIYRSNTLARINVADTISTPNARAELEAFRERFGRPAQETLLYHYARMIESVYACERALEIIKSPEITDLHVSNPATPGEGRGVGCVEAPRGTLFHDYETDANGLITRANLIVGTTHNLGAINLSADRAARDLIKNGRYDEAVLNKIEMAIRAYDP